MKKIILILFICSSIVANAQRIDFTGTYQLDKTKTSFGAAPKYVLTTSFLISQNSGTISISRTILSQELQLQKAISDTLSFSGSEFVGISILGNKVLTKMKWLDEAKFQIDKITLDKSNQQLSKVFETWSTTSDLKAIKLIRNVEQLNGLKYMIIGYYNKISKE